MEKIFKDNFRMFTNLNGEQVFINKMHVQAIIPMLNGIKVIVGSIGHELPGSAEGFLRRFDSLSNSVINVLQFSTDLVFHS